jgi:hypothetical protein
MAHKAIRRPYIVALFATLVCSSASAQVIVVPPAAQNVEIKVKKDQVLGVKVTLTADSVLTQGTELQINQEIPADLEDIIPAPLPDRKLKVSFTLNEDVTFPAGTELVVQTALAAGSNLFVAKGTVVKYLRPAPLLPSRTGFPAGTTKLSDEQILEELDLLGRRPDPTKAIGRLERVVANTAKANAAALQGINTKVDSIVRNVDSLDNRLTAVEGRLGTVESRPPVVVNTPPAPAPSVTVNCCPSCGGRAHSGRCR